MSNGLFLDTGSEVAKRYPDIAFDDMIVDATAMKLVIAPERFDVIVTMNLFGDILSRSHRRPDRRARRRAGGEHRRRAAARCSRRSTAPRPTSRARASRTRPALMLSAAMLLDHVGQSDAARRGCARASTRRSRNAETRTGDLGGKANTAQFTDAVIRAMR